MKDKGHAFGMANRGLVLLEYILKLALKWKVPEWNPIRL